MSSPFDPSAQPKGHRLPGRRRGQPGNDESVQAANESAAADATRKVPTVDPTQQMPVAPATQQMPAQPRQTPQRERIGRFDVVERIGEGGMGVVYRAFDPQTGQDVALKVLRPHIAYDASARTRLAREVATLERVSHPNIAAVIDADPQGERPYIATEFVPGVPLQDVIDKRGKFSPAQLADLGRDLASAVEAIHRAGVVHRDIKPSNVLLVGDRPVLIDFGIAHIADDARLTSTGLVMGTPGYLSPEVVEGAPVSASTDWWGWAATLAYAAQGEPPFGRGPMAVVLDRVTRGQADLSGVDERLRPLLTAALSPVPRERPSAQQVVEQMERYANGEPTTVVPVRRAPATRVMPAAEPTRVQPVERPRREPVHGGSAPGPQPYTSPEPASRYAPAQEPYSQPYPAPQGPAVGYAPQPAQPAAPRVKPQTYPGEHDPRIHLPARSGVLAGLFLAWLGVTALVPVVGLIGLIGWNIAARFSDFTVTQTVVRRYEAGRRKSDGAVAAVSSPVHLVRAVVSTLFALIIPLFVFACVVGIVGVGYAAATGGVARALWALPIVPGAAAAAWTMWRGAASTGYRRGARSIARAITPTPQMAQIVAGILVVLGGFFLLGSFLDHGDISMTPITSPVIDPLAEYLPN